MQTIQASSASAPDFFNTLLGSPSRPSGFLYWAISHGPHLSVSVDGLLTDALRPASACLLRNRIIDDPSSNPSMLLALVKLCE